mgnify:CR=1 FL=1
MLTRYENNSSTCAGASKIQPQQQMGSESADSTRLSDPANILDEPNDAQSSSPKSNTRRAAFWKTVGDDHRILSYRSALFGAYTQVPIDLSKHSSPRWDTASSSRS